MNKLTHRIVAVRNKVKILQRNRPDANSSVSVQLFACLRSYRGLFEPKGVKPYTLKSTFNAEHFIRYLKWFRRNSVLKCVLQPKIAKNSLKTPILGVQGRSRSSMLVPARRQCLL